jgi:WD40 repeat protein
MKYIDLKTQNISLIKGHKEIVLTLDLFDDYMISSGKDKIIKFWKKNEGLPTFEVLATFTGHLEAVNYVNFAPKTGNMFVSCSSDKNIKTWDLD